MRVRTAPLQRQLPARPAGVATAAEADRYRQSARLEAVPERFDPRPGARAEARPLPRVEGDQVDVDPQPRQQRRQRRLPYAILPTNC